MVEARPDSRSYLIYSSANSCNLDGSEYFCTIPNKLAPKHVCLLGTVAGVGYDPPSVSARSPRPDHRGRVLNRPRPRSNDVRTWLRCLRSGTKCQQSPFTRDERS